MHRKQAILVGIIAVFLRADLATAQATSAEQGAVSGVGTVSVKRRPERLRVKLDVFAASKSIKEALASLKDRREAIRGQLATMGADKDSIAFGEAQVNSSLLEGRQQVEMMIRSRMGRAAKKDPKKAAAAPTVVSASLSAEWPLKGQDTEALLIEIAHLQEIITAADLAGRKDLEKLGSDDDELKEEMEGVEAGGNDQGRPQIGTPAFLLVSKLTAQEQAQALADAFRKARAKAEATAKAAGAGLGPLRQLDSQMRPGTEGEDVEEGTAAYFRAMRAGRPEVIPEPDALLEAQGTQPGTVLFRVTVTAAFALKEGR